MLCLPTFLRVILPAGQAMRGRRWKTIASIWTSAAARKAGRRTGFPATRGVPSPWYTEELGPLPAEALLAKPEKSAEELEQEAQAKIKGRLAALDAKYLTPRTLAGLAVGDEYALEQWRAHEAEAEPFRIQLAAL